MSSIYVTCAGTSAANGIYDSVSGGYIHRDNPNYALAYVGSNWELQDVSYSPGIVLYSLNQVSVLSTSSWTASNGSAPAPKTYDYSIVANITSLDTLILSGAGEPTINDTYTWNPAKTVSLNTGSSYQISGYENGNYIVTYYTGSGVTGSVWQVYSVASFELYYSSNIPNTELPQGSFLYDMFYLGDTPGPTGALNTTTICGSTESSGANNYIYKNNNQNYILKSGSNFYIRKQ
jgi:hypothetical protein